MDWLTEIKDGENGFEVYLSITLATTVAVMKKMHIHAFMRYVQFCAAVA